MTAQWIAISDQFLLDAPPVDCRPFGGGHINRTFLVTAASGTRYVLQQINTHVFRDVPALMANIQAVTGYLRAQTDDPRAVLQLIPTRTGASYIRQDDGSCWRMTRFIEDAICLEQPQTPEDFYESAVAFGRFQQQLRDFPAATLRETIPNFHNTPERYRQFREVLAADPLGRAKSVRAEIDFALARQEEASVLTARLQAGLLPLRVTHNDTKLNNVMLDARTRKALCILDLDTVMPGLSLYDYGDSIRFGAAAAGEDEQDLSKMALRLDLFEIYTRGFLSACPDLTVQERKHLPLGAKTITLEQGVRFLTDYLDGDRYYATHRPGQNLDRARSQFKLAQDMEAKWAQMQAVVDRYA